MPPVATSEKKKMEGAPRPQRLDPGIKPESYNLRLKVDPDAGTFSGELSLKIRLKKAASRLMLHAADLKIERAGIDGEDIPAAAIKIDKAAETAAFGLRKNLQPGPAVLNISYSGTLNRQLRGLYLSTAKHEGKTENYAFTQFEPADARRMLPCFDEPAFKARFKLSVCAPAKYTLLSNMPAEKEEIQGGLKTVRFGETPLMSSYLLAVAVARLAPKSGRVGKTKVTVWTRPEDLHQADFALAAAKASLSRLNAYFDLPYELPKMDLVAVPDFAAGAMENWGAIFFRDSAILAHPKLSSAKARRRVAEVVAHEIVHQWFGDLVTMEWWNDLWLNEAFATWLAYKIVDDWKPGWLMWQSFERGKREALAVDSLKSTRPISSEVKSVAQIEAQFDMLTYEKGGAILRMLENFLGEKVFRKGLRRYIAKYRYQNTAAADLWRELEKASGQPVSKIAADWLTIPGYPEIEVSSLSPDNRRLRLVQRRFRAAGGAEASGPVWNAPLVVTAMGASGPRAHRMNLVQKETAATLPGRGRAKWIYPNAGQTGFLRCKLDSSLLAALDEPALRRLSPIERSGLLSDLWAQARAGETSIASFLDVLVLLRQDASRMATEDVAGYLSSLNDRLAGPADKPRLAALVLDIFSARWKALGWTPGKNESDETRLCRAAVLWVLGSVAKEPGILSRLDAKVSSYLRNPAGLDPALAGPVLNLGARAGGEKRFSDYLTALKSAATPELRDNLLRALAEFKDPALARRLLDASLGADIRGQDAWKPINILLGNTSAQGEAWLFIKARWPDIRRKIGDHACRRVVDGLSSLWRREWLNDIRAFFSLPENRVDMAQRALDQSLEWIELGIRFRETQTENLSRWLAKNRG